MITIEKNGNKLKVTKGAFENSFKALGYNVVENKKNIFKDVNVVEKHDEPKDKKDEKPNNENGKAKNNEVEK